MKILHAVHGYPPESITGVALYVRNIVQAQRRRGHDAYVLFPSLIGAEGPPGSP